ncbi:GTP-binding protein [Rhodoferax sp.]|uniref:sulfate adenylyltransferase subunit 1 n=1 Tax=Rhodoferax sp. TaxID=50421 RepID=UPI002623AB5C|nr:GTP-binding protein [Rhodoferax sp.]MDD2917989.1 GTP-binding protein [Rhodoferax sp.]
MTGFTISKDEVTTIRPELVEGSASTGSARTDFGSALKFITCGSVDDGKSTLIGRLLIDSRSVLQDQLANVSRSGEADLAQFTDGLSAEREQGITIDVAYRYFNTANRKFIIGDAPGHEQYTRNMVTAASSADAAVVLVDATKLQWQDPNLKLLPQTRRHALLCHLLRVPGIVFAVNKLDALGDNATPAFANIRGALAGFAQDADLEVSAIVPISALKGHNVVESVDGWCDYTGPSLLDILEELPVTPADTALPLAFPVQWVEKFSASADITQGRRVFWGRVAAGIAQVGQRIQVLPSGQTATVAQVLGHTRKPLSVAAGHSAGIVLDREVDVSRGDWLLALDSPAPCRELKVTVAWMDGEPLVAGRTYWALHGHRWVKARVKRVVHRLDINTLAEEDADALPANSIGHVELQLQEGIAARPYQESRVLGALVLVDTASHRTAGAVLLN